MNTNAREERLALPDPHLYPWMVPSFEDISASVCLSYYGWVMLMEKENFKCFLLNIASMEKIVLPNFSSKEFFPLQYEEYFVMTAPPTSTECVIALFSKQRSKVLIWRPGQLEWNELKYESHKISHTVVCNKKIYCIVDSEHFGVCNISNTVEDTLSITILGPRPSIRRRNVGCISKYLIGVCDEIFSIQMIRSRKVEIDVMGELKKAGDDLLAMDAYKFDNTSQKWNYVSDIGGCVFFLNEAHSFRCSATKDPKIIGNCVYFLKDDRLNIWDMNRNTIQCMCAPSKKEKHACTVNEE